MFNIIPIENDIQRVHFVREYLGCSLGFYVMWLIIILLLSLSTSTVLLCHRCFNQQQVNACSQINMLLVLIMCVVSPLLISTHSAWSYSIPTIDGLALSIDLYYDELTWVMLCLVSFVSLIIHSYTATYLASDHNQSRFIGQLSLLTFSVILLMMSGGLLTAFIAWQLIGLSLYLLLNHYHYDVKANKAAKKKFMINRVGDMCFLLAVIIALDQYGSTAFSVLFQHQADINDAILALIFVAIMTKSAQFPFHIWLIDTMEAPTPVSALMHAGVINAGGFLLARLSLLYGEAHHLLLFIFLVGLMTTLLGSFFARHQPDVKKQLAYSTMSQMGYMVMQCGLGCFSSAVFHLIAHGFFKATLFLSAGSTLKQQNQPSQQSTFTNSRWQVALMSVLITALLVGLGMYGLADADGKLYLDYFLWLFISVTVFQLIKQVLSQSAHSYLVKIGLVSLISLIFVIYLLLLKRFSLLLSDSVDENAFFLLGWGAVTVVVLIMPVYFFVKDQLSDSVKKILLCKIYFAGFYKGGIERYYRRYLINPMRKWGDWLLATYCQLSTATKCITLLLLAVYLAISVSYSLGLQHPFLSPAEIGIIFVDLTLLLISLLIANRVENLVQLVMTLLLSMLILSGITASIDKHSLGLIGVFHMVNMLLLMGSFWLLLLKREYIPHHDNLVQNQLPWCHFYMSLLLVLLIGIPGTASFISEFYLLQGLVQVHYLFVMMFSISMMLLSLVVLHTLQIHFFNPKAIAQYAVVIPPWLHGICILVIAVNVINGIYPSMLLTTISGIVG